MRWHSSRALALLLLVGMSSACVHPNKPGVAISSVEANVVFGVDTAPKPVVPANTAAGPIPEQATTAGFDFNRFHNSAADKLPDFTTVPQDNPCPEAPPTAAADKPAEATITGKPMEGTYLWKRVGTQTKPNPAGGDPIKTKITGFEKRIIRNVKPYDDPYDPDAYTFEMVQTLLDRPVIQIRTFLVKPKSSAQAQPGGVPVVAEPRASEPEAGVSLIKVEEQNEDGDTTGSFNPTSGLLLARLPIDPSDTFQSSAVDPRTGQTIFSDAATRGRSRIDACGDLVDGWRVETTQTRSDESGSVAYNYLIATQYGGVLILEEIHTTAADGSKLDVTLSLGQLNPDPVEGS
jgi:hypothetical protein